MSGGWFVVALRSVKGDYGAKPQSEHELSHDKIDHAVGNGDDFDHFLAVQ